ncbi:hypothetical protein HYU82_00810 [Candidatus Saccharibacteria bacterium]|nr:hypothetical protein [Candidatus Saccharibacteria bacterium]
MEWKDGKQFEFKPGHEVPVAPRLLMDIAEAELINYASEEEIPFHELMYLQKSIMGRGLARQIYQRYEDCARKPISKEDYSVIDIDIVASMDTSAENALIDTETDGAYIVSDAYAGYSIRMMTMKKIAKSGKRRRLRDEVVNIQLRYKEDDTSLIEFFLNDDPSIEEAIDVTVMLSGWQESPRKPATVLQKVILARILEDLLNPQDPVKTDTI